MPAPLIAAGAVAARGGAAVARGAAGAAQNGARLLNNATNTKKAYSLLKKIAALRIVWAAALFDLVQLFLNLIYLGIAGFVESLPFVARGFIDVIGGEFVVLFVWGLSVAVMLAGYLSCGLAFAWQGTKLVGERHAGIKLPLIIICMCADYMFPVNGLLPGMTLWAWYLFTNPK